jgi:hypothetical protein
LVDKKIMSFILKIMDHPQNPKNQIFNFGSIHNHMSNQNILKYFKIKNLLNLIEIQSSVFS